MPEVPQTSAAVWVIQHRSWRRPTPSRSWRPGRTLHCICCNRSNLFLKILSLTFSTWGPNVYFQWKSQQTTCWVHANVLTQTFTEVIHWGWYSPQLRAATFTGWILTTVVRCFLSNDSCGYSSVHTYSNILVLQRTFWLVQARFHLLLPALQCHHSKYCASAAAWENTWLASAQTAQKDANLISLLLCPPQSCTKLLV